MGAVQTTASQHKRSSLTKDTISSHDSAMKSPASEKKNLRVTFTSKEPSGFKATDRDTPLPTSPARSHKNGILRSNSNPDSSHRKTRHGDGRSNGNVENSSLVNGSIPYVPTHLPLSANRSNNNYSPDRYSLYDNADFSTAKASTRRSRARSVSPRRTEKILVPRSFSRSEAEDFVTAVRSRRK